ncbi:hypothetical protein AXE80_08460 [Wenyingzhuangia fucanilytica]|uniref:Glycosyltransferase 2-like domain-containing protein n=1 Tax=Wenyingzhuangia fucanilytica TaxID=1790137 RepID=A0A1B1Y6D5_9FLAO|nr:glycosyltransferase family 2 protein [Wenyingzhuangia fucanilytica]ANW96307.1 hypothetical protein AXE80_08460 [Wenyingzhuangia fucanilytica]
MHNQSLITIILTTYNRAHLIRETLDSIIAQTYSNWKCIIIDDNSNDNTSEVIQEYIKKDIRFQYHVKGDKYVKGLSASRNMGMDLIETTDFIHFFDDDDIMHPQKFEIQLKEFEKYSNLDLTVFPTVNFKDGEKLNIELINQKVESNIIANIAEDFILLKRIFTAQVPLIKYEYIKEVRFNEQLFYAEEWEVFNKLFFTKSTKASYVNKPLYYHRKHNISITANFYGKTNIKEISNNQAFINVYQVVKNSPLFNGRIFSRFITFAYNNKQNDELLTKIKSDLKKGLLSNRFKDIAVIVLVFCARLHGSLFIKLIHRVARW